MRICVLQPSYKGSSFDYQHYDVARDLTTLLPEHTVHHELLRKATTYSQLKALARQGFDIYVNLCEGYLDSDIPSIDVIYALEELQLPYTGPSPQLYDPPKELMKIVAEYAGVATPDWIVAEVIEDAVKAIEQLRFPLFVKPHAAGDSMGIDENSRVDTEDILCRKLQNILAEYGKALIEEYIPGREFTVLVCGAINPLDPPLVLNPVEFLFPPDVGFKTYDLKVCQYHPESNIPCVDPVLARLLQESACRIFQEFAGEGYARMDFRLAPDGELYFLEVNFTCSVLYPEGYYGSADYILQYDGLGQAGFLRHIIAEGLARHLRRQKPYRVCRSPLGYGIFATQTLNAGDVVLHGEERCYRLVTSQHVERTWNAAQRQRFREYAFPLGRDTFMIWNENPAAWEPLNHSCDPNVRMDGLNMVAVRAINPGEELLIDYATFVHPHMAGFTCRCGSLCCRRYIGSVTE